jgi:hypothetical protein
VHLDMVWMSVAPELVVEGQYVGALFTQNLGEPLGRTGRIEQRERYRSVAASQGGLFRAGIQIAQMDYPGTAERLASALKLSQALGTK